MPKRSKLLTAFGAVIRDERHKKGYSQEGLAEIANLHRTYIGMIERAEKNITIENMAKISGALDISLEEVFRRMGR